MELSDINDLWGTPHHCPRCVWPYLHPEAGANETYWHCESCGQRWTLEHGELRPVVLARRVA
ncbi:MAG TPA: hypothetical protein VN636_00525 [Acidimicrobiia bacterium]|nr:hypothetical protein [Acidimicrobiia bacterium]